MSATPPVATVPAVAERERAELDDVRASLFVPARAAALEADFDDVAHAPGQVPLALDAVGF